ncbi:MAG: M20 family metallopeptidase [Candidatus Polarisedimenticolia bacterium]
MHLAATPLGWMMAVLAATTPPPAAVPQDLMTRVASRLARLTDEPAVRAALADADAGLTRFVDDWVRVAEIPAPSGHEGPRADYLEKRFRELGLSEVRRDEAGNVLGLKPGRRRDLPRVALLAHMDTVAPASADHTVRRPRPDRLQGPGVRDDSSGLAGLLALLDLMQRHGLQPAADLFVVASVSEEVGLKGADRFVHENAADLGAVIAVDGHLGQISYAATGILWLKLRFLGDGAHTLRAYEKASPILAAARAMERVAALDIRRTPPEMESWLNIGMMGGGDVPNAQPREAWFVVDLRSNDGATFEALERKVRDIAARTARETGVQVEIDTLHRMAGARIPGLESSPLVTSARAVLDRLGWVAVDLTPRGTADHNVALLRGIPGIAIGMTTGDGAHTPDEFAEIPPFAIGVKQLLLLTLLPLTPE